jgi:hypothetical protein
MFFRFPIGSGPLILGQITSGSLEQETKINSIDNRIIKKDILFLIIAIYLDIKIRLSNKNI